MFARINNFLCSISVKLFLWLWLVTITSISLTYFITVQLIPTTSISTPNKHSQSLLKSLANKINQKNTINIAKEQERFFQRTQQHLILKELSSNNIYFPKNTYWSNVKEYLSENNFINEASIEFSNTRLTGPKLVNINNQQYHLFIATDNTYQKLNFFFREFPLWLRLLLLFSISFILCWLFAKNISKPLVRIQNAAINFGKGNLTTRLSSETKRRDELGAVAKSFNLMAAQLENNINAHQRLLGDVSHELRSPLTRLQMALGLVETYQGQPDKQAPHLNRCDKEIEMLDKMIADVLTLSRLEHASISIQLSSINLHSLIKLVCDDCQYLADQKNVEILLPPLTQPILTADEKLITSAFSNILNNAVKYAPENSKITVALENSSDSIYLSVSDQGTGVPDETLSQLFKAFYRVAEARDRESGGTGLGLAIAHQAIELHHGKIYATNNTHGGLTVHVELPLTH